MNKLFTKAAKILLGLSLAAGVGVAVGSQSKAAERADAAISQVGQIAFKTGNTISGNTGTQIQTSTNISTYATQTPSGYFGTKASAVSSSYYASASSTNGAGQGGIRVGKSSGAGSITFTLATAITNAARVDIVSYQCSSGKTLSVAQSSDSAKTPTSSSNTYSFSLPSSVSAITINTSGQLWITSIALFAGDVDITQEISGATSAYTDETVTLTSNATSPSWSIVTESTTAAGAAVTSAGVVSATGAGTVVVKASKTGYTDATHTITFSVRPTTPYVTVDSTLVGTIGGNTSLGYTSGNLTGTLSIISSDTTKVTVGTPSNTGNGSGSVQVNFVAIGSSTLSFKDGGNTISTCAVTVKDLSYDIVFTTDASCTDTSTAVDFTAYTIPSGVTLDNKVNFVYGAAQGTNIKVNKGSGEASSFDVTIPNTKYVKSITISAAYWSSDTTARLEIIPDGGSAVTASSGALASNDFSDLEFDIASSAVNKFTVKSAVGGKRVFIAAMSIYYADVSSLGTIIELSASNIVMEYGDSDVSPSVVNKDTSEAISDCHFVSGDTSVATIINEKVHAVSKGVATITVSHDPDTANSISYKSTTFTVTVNRTYTIQEIYDLANNASIEFNGYYAGEYADGIVLMDGAYGIIVYHGASEEGWVVDQTIVHVSGSRTSYSGLVEVANGATLTELTGAEATAAAAKLSLPTNQDLTQITPATAPANVASRRTYVAGTLKSITASSSNYNIVVTVEETDVALFLKSDDNVNITVSAGTMTISAYLTSQVNKSVTIKGFTSFFNSNFQVRVYDIVEASASYTAADFAQDVLDDTDAVCSSAAEPYNYKSALTSVWNGLEDKWRTLSSTEQDEWNDTTKYTPDYENDSSEVIENALGRYNFLCKKYSFSNFTERSDVNGAPVTPAGSNILLSSITENTNTVAIIVVISMVSVTAIGGYFFLKKRREQN